MRTYIWNKLTCEVSYFLDCISAKLPDVDKAEAIEAVLKSAPARFVFLTLGPEQVKGKYGNTKWPAFFKSWHSAGRRVNAWWRAEAGDLHIYLFDRGPDSPAAEPSATKKPQYRDYGPYWGGLYTLKDRRSTYGTDGSCGIWFTDLADPPAPKTEDPSFYETKMLSLWQLPAQLSAARRALLEKHGWWRVLKTDVAQFWTNGKKLEAA